MFQILSEKDGLPDYEKLEPSVIKTEMLSLLKETRREISQLYELNDDELHFDSLVERFEELMDKVSKAWAPVSHMNSVVNTDELRTVHDEIDVELAKLYTELNQSRALYECFSKLKGHTDFAALNHAEKRVVENNLRDFRLSGVDLEESARSRLKEISQQLSTLSNEFSKNVLKSTDEWQKHIVDAGVLDGIPRSNIAVAEELALSKGMDGYVLTLEMPSYASVMSFAHDRSLREEVYEAYLTRASDLGPTAGKYDNRSIIRSILELRQEKADLLGFQNFAELSLATKMANNVDDVCEFLDDLLDKALISARREIANLQNYAVETLSYDSLQAWDVRYVLERLKREKFDLDQEHVRSYFPVDRVLQGMFTVVEQLYDIEIRPAEVPSKWHEDVRFFEIFVQGQKVARFYLDLFSRPHKRSGAWAADCRVRREHGNFLQLPVAYLTCNFTPATKSIPSLLTHAEVVTLFHEFGHGLHHMLTKQKLGSISGFNGVEWDAVELPSQFMENWCYQPEGIRQISEHFETKEPLPESELRKIIAAKNYGSGIAMVRQLEFGMFDFSLHNAAAAVDPIENMAAVRRRTALTTVPEYDRFPCAFGHIFAGGYAAGYYSYLWAEVLSSDAFAAFEEEGLLDATRGFGTVTAARFRDVILASGGSEPAADLFRRFRGREPNADALLKHNGLA